MKPVILVIGMRFAKGVSLCRSCYDTAITHDTSKAYPDSMSDSGFMMSIYSDTHENFTCAHCSVNFGKTYVK